MCSHSFISTIWLILTLSSATIIVQIQCQAVENSNSSHLVVSKSFTLAQSDSHILLNANGTVAQRLFASKREISFDFRTRNPNGIILYETFAINSLHIGEYSLLLALLNGRFQVLLEYQGQQDGLTIGYSFNRDLLHRVTLYINPELGFLNIRVNATESTKYYKSLYFNFTSTQLSNDDGDDPTIVSTYRLSFGGLSFTNQTSFYHLNGYQNFVGCIGNINLVSRSNESNFGTLSQSVLSFHQITDGCVDQCAQLNLCSRRARCVNYYNSKQCDCFGTELEDWHCRSVNYTVLTLRGHSTISYKAYEYLSKSYSDQHLVGLHIRTLHDSVLFTALSETSKTYLILNLKNGFLNVLYNLGHNPKNYIFNDFKLIDNEWHNITLIQQHSQIFVYLDVNTSHTIVLDETDPYFNFDPEIYVGGFPSNLNITNLKLPIYLPNKKFVGCLKHVYFNSVNVLYELKRGNRAAKYHSLFDIELGCKKITAVPITIQPNSYFRVGINRTQSFDLEFEFRLRRLNSRIANGTFITGENEKRRWHLQLRKLDVKLSIEHPTIRQIRWTLSNDNSLNISTWNKVTIEAKSDGFIKMTVNEFSVQGKYDLSVESFRSEITIGSVDARFPFIGCIRNLLVNHERLEPRTLSDQGLVVGRVSLDDCRLLDPCNRPNPCEHGGVCVPVPENGTFWCDCSNTGYIGQTCHFSVYRKSCEEIYHMDKRHSGIFMIDIDRNGPFPPAHVICDLIHNENGTVSYRTVIEHNIQHQMIVREKGQRDNLVMDVVYRDFNREMLLHLVRRADRCQQYVKYECNDAPLSLSSYTLLYSTIPDKKLNHIEGSIEKGCKCGSSPNSCIDQRKNCNCDSEHSGWKHDEGTLTNANDVGITKMFFLQLPNMTSESEAHLFLGNLSCIDIDTQKYQITFKTKQSYLQVPGWIGRELGISFRTTASKAVIFFQSHLDSRSTYFKAEIISENEIRFEYSLLNRKNVVIISSGHCLNCGQWQHVWIERNDNQMRVSINQNSRIMYLPNNDKFINFDGKLFVGGAPLDYLKGLKIHLGFIGCLRGLVIDDEVINLHQYLDYRRKPNIESGCRPYCKPNLCQNQGHCVEKWGSYECRCANPIAHSGPNCEININENSMTFKSQYYVRQEIVSNNRIKSILQDDIVLSFRTHSHSALLLYAHDTHNNFIQLHVQNGTTVVFTFNWLRRIVRREINVGTALNSGQPIQVKVDRSYKNSSNFIVNQKSLYVPYPVTLLKDNPISKSWLAGQEYELINLNNPQGSRWLNNELYVGGFESVEGVSRLPGFVGCIQGLKVGKQLVDLKQIALDSNGTELGKHVKAGCNMLCDQMPCKNGGICTEVWGETTKCDCNSTSYRGNLCDIDIGASFQKDSSVMYFLENNETLDFTNISISFAFSTSNVDNSTIFLLRYANSTRYLHIAVLDDGQLMVEEDNGHDIYQSVILEEDTFLDSHRHWVHYFRKEGSAQVIVDSRIYILTGVNFLETLKNSPQATENVIIIGSNRINNQDMEPFSSFKGCISNIDIMLDDFKIDPFESAFGIRSGLSNVKVVGQVTQGICASFHTHREIISNQAIQMTVTRSNQREIWLNRPKPSLVRFNRTNKSSQQSGHMHRNIIIAVCAVYLLLILIFICIYLWKVDRHYKLLKFQGETPFFHKKPNLKKRTSQFAL